MMKFGTIVDWMNTFITDYYCFFFSKSSFLDPWDPFCHKDLGHPGEFKNGTIILKFGTLIDFGDCFSFFKKRSFLLLLF